MTATLAQVPDRTEARGSILAYPTTKKGSRLRILISEDDLHIADLIHLVFMGSEHDAQVTYDGEAALEAFAAADFDVAIIDVMMPKLDGLGAIAAIRAAGDRGRDLAVVLLSARAGDGDRVRGFEAGADVYVTKPFDPDRLITTVEEVGARSREEREAIRAEALAHARSMLPPDAEL